MSTAVERSPVAMVASPIIACLAAALATALPTTARGQAVSFSRQVAPLLARQCGNCHVSGRKGGFHMPSYAALMSSDMVQRGAGAASRLVEVIETGDMPRGGGRVSRDDLAMLVRWIDAGAAFDGADPTAALTAAASAAAPPAAPGAPAAPAATSTAGKERPLRPGDVSFSAAVAPVLLEHCAGCHGADDPAGRLQLRSLATLLQGGRTGRPVIAGKSADSLLIKKLRGIDIEGQRMPRGRPPLPDEVIAMIATWIDQGATIDALGSTTPLKTVAARGRARTMSDAELRNIRRAAAAGPWQRAIPDEPPVVVPTERIVLVGNLPEPRMNELAETASRLEARIRAELVSGEAPLLKGGVVLYLFRHGYDYSSFWQTVVRAERPKGIVGHAGLLGDVAYGAVLVPGSAVDPATTDALLAEQIAGAALAGRDLPPWFVRGAGRVVASRVVPKAALVQEWRRDAAPAARELGSTADFFAGHGDAALVALAAGGFVAGLATPSARLPQLVTAIDQDVPFDDAVAKIVRGSPKQLYDAWAAKQQSARPARGGR